MVQSFHLNAETEEVLNVSLILTGATCFSKAGYVFENKNCVGNECLVFVSLRYIEFVRLKSVVLVKLKKCQFFILKKKIFILIFAN